MNTILLSLASTLLSTAPQATAPDPAPLYTLTVALFNDAHVPPTVLAGAQETASYIFAKSGIDIRWMLCGREDESLEERNACSQPEFPDHLDMHIVKSCPHLPGSVFGISYLSPEGIGTQADVFYVKIAAFRQSPAEMSTLLGYAMAHEVGHLLLGSNSHSPNGLMRADWRTKELIGMAQGGLGFVEEQTQTMKAKLSTFALRKEASPRRTATINPTMPAAGSSLTSLEMPFELYNGYLIVVEGRIGDLTGLKFILDTGVTTSVLDSKIAAKLKLSGRPNHVFNIDKTVPVESSTIPEVRFGPVQARNVEMLIANLNTLSDFARGVDALIGVDLLRLNNLTFDYDRRRVLFSPIDHNIQRAQMRPEPAYFTVRVQVQGHPIDLLLDTGLEGVLLYEDRIRAHVPGLRMEPGVKKVTIGRRMNAKLVTLPEMRVGPKVMDRQVLLIKGPPGNMLDGLDGAIGIAPFHPKRIAFDFASKTLRWD